MNKNKVHPGFTMVEVLAALGIIVVLTLILVATLRSQVNLAQKRNDEMIVETLNTQIEVNYSQEAELRGDFASVAKLIENGIIGVKQWEQIKFRAVYTPAAGRQLPKITLTSSP